MRNFFKRMIAMVLVLACVFTSSPIVVFAASSSQSSTYTTYTEKEQTSTGIQIGKNYRIYKMRVHYTYNDCINLRRQAQQMQNGSDIAAFMGRLVPNAGNIVSVLITLMGRSAGNYVNTFNTAIGRGKGITVTYDYWVCMNGTVHDNKAKNNVLRYE